MVYQSLSLDNGVSVRLNSDDGDSIPLDPLDIHIHVPEQKKINIRFPNLKTPKPSQVRKQTLFA